MNILTICPSIYPDRLYKMSESFYRTSTANNILVIINEGTVTKAINSCMNRIDGFDFIHITNDDVIYETDGWDSKFLEYASKNGTGIYYGNDGFQGDNLCTFPFISAAIIKSLGWIQLPTLKHYCGDVVWLFIGQQCDCLHYCPDISINHDWDGKVDHGKHLLDKKAFAEWLPWSFKDIAKVKGVLSV